MEKINPFASHSLAFITTNDCTAACDHCLMCCSPGAKSYLSSQQMIKAIDEVHEKYGVNVVIFTGGEPMLLGKELFRTIAYCTKKGIFTRVVTNAYWADTFENTKVYLNLFRAAGLGEINVSYDDYHAQYIPEENIKNIWNCAKGMGFHAVVVSNSNGVDSVIDPEYIQKMLGEKISVWNLGDTYSFQDIQEARQDDGTAYIIARNNVKKIGRAAEMLEENSFASKTSTEEITFEGCGTICRQPAVSYDNHLLACCGINTQANPILDLGNLNENTAEALMNRATDSILVNAIREVGPKLLMEYVKEFEPNITFQENYHSLCEMCADLTQNTQAVNLLKNNIGGVYYLIKEARKLREGNSVEASVPQNDN